MHTYARTNRYAYAFKYTIFPYATFARALPPSHGYLRYPSGQLTRESRVPCLAFRVPPRTWTWERQVFFNNVHSPCGRREPGFLLADLTRFYSFYWSKIYWSNDCFSPLSIKFTGPIFFFYLIDSNNQVLF